MTAGLTVEQKAIKSKSAYAWIASGSGFLSQVICVWGLSIFGISMSTIAADLGVAVSALGIATSIYGACYAGFSVLWGNLADRRGLRKTLSLAVVGIGVFLILAGQLATSAVAAIALYALAGVFASGTASAVLPKLISTWFAANSRGKGMTLVTLGGSVAGVLGGILFPRFLMSMGWHGTFTLVGIIAIVVGAIIFALLRDEPAAVGTYPFGSPAGTPVASTEKQLTDENKAANRANAIRVLKMPITWKYGILYIFWQFTLMAYQAYTVVAAQAAGMDLVAASLITTIVTAFMALGTIFFPFLSDKIGRKPSIVAASFLTAAAAIVAFFAYGAGAAAAPIIIYVIYAIYGFSNAVTPLHNTAMAECYPVELRGAGPGMISSIAIVGRFGGPILAGALIAATGDTTAAILFTGITVLISGILSLFWIPRTGGKYGDPEAKNFGIHRTDSFPDRKTGPTFVRTPSFLVWF